MAEEKKDKEVIENGVSEREALPKAIVRRVVKEKLSQLSTNSEISVLRDSLLAFSESARIFIHNLSATANDICKESNRQIISAEDVFKALEEIEFPEFIGPLRASLEEFRQRNAQRKSSSSKDAGKKSALPKDAGKKSPSPKDAGKKSPSPKDAGKKSPSPKDAGKKSPSPKDAGKKSPSPKDAGKKSPPSKVKSTKKKAKRKEPSAQSEGRKKRRVGESDGDKVSD